MKPIRFIWHGAVVGNNGVACLRTSQQRQGRDHHILLASRETMWTTVIR